MVIGIDASRGFVEERTGTETYTYQSVLSLLKLADARKNKFYLYLYLGQASRLRQILDKKVPGWQEFVSLREIRLPRLWTQVGLALRTWADPLDVLWVPAHTLPFFSNPNVKLVVTIHGLEYEFLPRYYGEWARWHLTWSTEMAVKRATKIIAVSNFTKQALVERLNADSSKIQVVYEGRGEEEASDRITESRVAHNLMNKYDIKPKSYILFVGTIQPRKNIIRLIEAFEKLNGSPAGKNIKLVISGKIGWQYEEILAAPSNLGLDGKIIFTGYTNKAEKDILMQNALVYVQPSLTEGFGLPVLEAMAKGIPVVSSTGGALPEVVGNAAVTFDPLDTIAMTRALGRVLENKELRKKLISKGYTRINQFSWGKTAEEILKIFMILSRSK
jgi:glycosyltransferase involved in cell wall biosynthesis